MAEMKGKVHTADSLKHDHRTNNITSNITSNVTSNNTSDNIDTNTDPNADANTTTYSCHDHNLSCRATLPKTSTACLSSTITARSLANHLRSAGTLPSSST